MEIISNALYIDLHSLLLGSFGACSHVTMAICNSSCWGKVSILSAHLKKGADLFSATALSRKLYLCPCASPGAQFLGLPRRHTGLLLSRKELPTDPAACSSGDLVFSLGLSLLLHLEVNTGPAVVRLVYFAHLGYTELKFFFFLFF